MKSAYASIYSIYILVIYSYQTNRYKSYFLLYCCMLTISIAPDSLPTRNAKEILLKVQYLGLTKLKQYISRNKNQFW